MLSLWLIIMILNWNSEHTFVIPPYGTAESSISFLSLYLSTRQSTQ